LIAAGHLPGDAMATYNVISVSGGKDSTATLLVAFERCPRKSIVPIFCDTGNEHTEVYGYLDYLEHSLGIKIHRLRSDFAEQIAAKRAFIARDQRTGRDSHERRLRWSNKAKRRALAALAPTGNPFLDLCLWKGRFPSRRAQFCTEELKRNEIVSFQLGLIDAGYSVISWQGIRREESQNRRDAKKIERIGPRMWAFRPLVDWTAEQVFEQHRKSGIAPNPLYRQGMTRVGCMPCINVNKHELREIAARFPEHIDRIVRWEAIVSQASKRGFSTLMHKQKASGTPREIFERESILEHVAWAKTTRGGKQFDLFNDAGATACASTYGLCE
jgi:3'-phosphoadenosine 5'-phosphosulfate sulfotransferase (PAPS reductase)/FAD synthetase